MNNPVLRLPQSMLRSVTVNMTRESLIAGYSSTTRITARCAEYLPVVLFFGVGYTSMKTLATCRSSDVFLGGGEVLFALSHLTLVVA